VKRSSSAPSFAAISKSAAWYELKTALDSENVHSPTRMSRRGKKTGGASTSRGHLYWILSNLVYVGWLRHKGRIHDGLHPAIEDIETWGPGPRPAQEPNADKANILSR